MVPGRTERFRDRPYSLTFVSGGGGDFPTFVQRRRCDAAGTCTGRTGMPVHWSFGSHLENREFTYRMMYDTVGGCGVRHRPLRRATDRSPRLLAGGCRRPIRRKWSVGPTLISWVRMPQVPVRRSDGPGANSGVSPFWRNAAVPCSWVDERAVPGPGEQVVQVGDHRLALGRPGPHGHVAVGPDE